CRRADICAECRLDHFNRPAHTEEEAASGGAARLRDRVSKIPRARPDTADRASCVRSTLHRARSVSRRVVIESCAQTRIATVFIRTEQVLRPSRSAGPAPDSGALSKKVKI